MIKVIIISYFYPPANFVGGERIESWAKYLIQFGIYPIIITRQWNPDQKDITDAISSNEYELEKTENYEVHRMPYNRTLRDKCADYKIFGPLQKILTLKELIFSNYFINALPYMNIYNKARELINSNTIAAVIASGRPFQSFALGYRLKQEFDVLWVPDYRDEWTTHQHHETDNWIRKRLWKLERKSELKWTSNADFFTTVSDNWRKNIQNLIQIEGHVVLNGYQKLKTRKTANTNKTFVITYAGTLYPSQDINPFIESCCDLYDQGKEITVKFVGANVISSEVDKIKSKIGNRSCFEFIDRLPRNELELLFDQSDLLFLTNFRNIRGWYPVKLFEYYAAGIPVLLCPSDDDVMKDFIENSGIGFTVENREECSTIMRNLIKLKSEGKTISYNRNEEYGQQFSRKQQTAVLAEILNSKCHGRKS